MAADVSVKVGKALAIELERATKKNPPSRTKVSLIFTGREEWERGEEELKEAGKGEGSGQGSVWRGLRADLDGAGLAKIFIVSPGILFDPSDVALADKPQPSYRYRATQRVRLPVSVVI